MADAIGVFLREENGQDITEYTVLIEIVALTTIGFRRRKERL